MALEHLTHTLPRITELYHGTSDEGGIIIRNIPTWFGDVDAARTYGPVVFKFKVNRDLRLLDVSSPAFHADFIGRVNNLYKGSKQSGLDPKKENALAQLGLPDLETQMLIVQPMSGGMYERPDEEDERGNLQYDRILRFVGYFGRHHRYSLATPEINLERDMVNAMRLAYPTHDGYICPIMWPSFHHGGFLLPEICIFDPVASGVTLNNRVSGGARKRKTPVPTRSVLKDKKSVPPRSAVGGGGFVVPPRVRVVDPIYGEIMVTACVGMFNDNVG